MVRKTEQGWDRQRESASGRKFKNRTDAARRGASATHAYPSVRAARVRAGMVKPRTAAERTAAAAAAVERETDAEQVAADTREREGAGVDRARRDAANRKQVHPPCGCGCGRPGSTSNVRGTDAKGEEWVLVLSPACLSRRDEAAEESRKRRVIAMSRNRREREARSDELAARDTARAK